MLMIFLKIIFMYLLKHNGVYTTTPSKGMTSLAFPQRWRFPASCHCKANGLYFCLYKLILHRSDFEKLKRLSLLQLPTFCLFAYSWWWPQGWNPRRGATQGHILPLGHLSAPPAPLCIRKTSVWTFIKFGNGGSSDCCNMQNLLEPHDYLFCVFHPLIHNHLKWPWRYVTMFASTAMTASSLPSMFQSLMTMTASVQLLCF